MSGRHYGKSRSSFYRRQASERRQQRPVERDTTNHDHNDYSHNDGAAINVDEPENDGAAIHVDADETQFDDLINNLFMVMDGESSLDSSLDNTSSDEDSLTAKGMMAKRLTVEKMKFQASCGLI